MKEEIVYLQPLELSELQVFNMTAPRVVVVDDEHGKPVIVGTKRWRRRRAWAGGATWNDTEPMVADDWMVGEYLTPAKSTDELQIVWARVSFEAPPPIVVRRK